MHTYISNVKAHFVLPKTDNLKARLLALKCGSVVCHHNFIVFRKFFCYVIFFDSGHVNVTKIAGLTHCKAAAELLYDALDIPQIPPPQITVDNITAAGFLGRRIDLNRLKSQSTGQSIRVRFNRHIFPGAVCKVHELCTVIVFASGKYTCVGAKCVKQIQEALAKIAVLIEEQ